jgi:alkylhydroperoxidase family enzyme
MHTQEALKIGETPKRIFALSAWRESPLFTEKEKAVLKLTEEVTEMTRDGITDETYDSVLKFYGENGLAQIIMQVIIINSWNRIAVSTHAIFE